MDIKYIRLFATIFLVLVIPGIAWAHLPYLERNKTEIIVKNPEISKAYYGWLQGEPAVYSMSSPKPFLLYLNLLSPRIENGKMDYSMAIMSNDGEILAEAVGSDAFWLVTYEPFANDYYSKGPEYEARLPAGNYKVKVYNSGNSGNYVLAIGKTEDLSLGEFIRTLIVLPSIKQEFFGQYPWQAYNNFIGLGALILIVVICIIFYFAISLIRKSRAKKRLDYEYKNNRRDRGESRRRPSET